MRYLNILDCTISDGRGMRVSLYLSGCDHHCKGCHNPESWDPNNGKEFTRDVEDCLISLLKRPYIKGLTITGGDPLFKNNVNDVINLCKKIKIMCPDKDIWIYTGYMFEDLLVDDFRKPILDVIDVLVDGEFVLGLRDVTLPFRGSLNQRIIKKRED